MHPLRRQLIAAICGLCFCPAVLAQESTRQDAPDSGLEIQFDTGSIRASGGGRLTTDEQGQEVVLFRDALYTQPPWLVRADELRLWPELNRLLATDVQFEYGDTATGTAQRLRATGAGDSNQLGTLTLEDFSVAWCDAEEGEIGWSIGGRSMQMDRDQELARIRNLSLQLFGIRLPGPPLSRLPLDGRSLTGLLTPEIRLNTDDELDVVLPFLLTLGPSSDLTLAPRRLGERGTGLETELRYRLNDQQGNLIGIDLDTDRGRWQAQHWMHRATWGNWGLELDYAEVDEEAFLSRYGLATVTIPSLYGLYPQKLLLAYRTARAWAEIVTQRLHGPTGSFLGEHSSEYDLRLHLGDRNKAWYWGLEAERGRYGWVGNELFAGVGDDRPLGADAEIDRLFAAVEAGWHGQLPLGWLRIGTSLRQREQGDSRQSSSLLEIDAGLRLASAKFRLHPRLQYRAVEFDSSGPVPQNLDSGVLPASVASLWQNPVTGADLLPARDRLAIGADLFSVAGDMQLRSSFAVARYSRAPAGSLLATLSPDLVAEVQRLQILEFELDSGTTGRLTAHLSRGSDRDNSRTLAWRLDGKLGYFSLRWTRRLLGAGRNQAELRSLASSVRTWLGGNWYLELIGSRDLERDRSIYSALAVGYDGCCFEMRLGASESLRTDYRSADSDHWLEWLNLPVIERSNTLFSLRLKTGR